MLKWSEWIIVQQVKKSAFHLALKNVMLFVGSKAAAILKNVELKIWIFNFENLYKVIII